MRACVGYAEDRRDNFVIQRRQLFQQPPKRLPLNSHLSVPLFLIVNGHRNRSPILMLSQRERGQ